jgi:hypothetical protein
MSSIVARRRTRTAATPAAAGAPATTIERRTSLSRGPALILGTILTAAGLYFLYRAHLFPRNVPNGRAPVETHAIFGVFGINGWTGMLTAVAGGLLLIGAAEHFLSKFMSLFVGCCLAAAAIIAAISGDVLGFAAANVWTEVGWGASALILLLNALLPRRRRLIETSAAGAGGYAGMGATEGTERRPFERTRRITGGPANPPADGTAPVDGAAVDQPGTVAPGARSTATRDL